MKNKEYMSLTKMIEYVEKTLKYTNIEWNMIKGLRNRIVHDYEGISIKSI